MPWETCMTICRQWAWRPKDRMKSLSECIRTLVSCAGGDGNSRLQCPIDFERLRLPGRIVCWRTRAGGSVIRIAGAEPDTGAERCVE